MLPADKTVPVLALSGYHELGEGTKSVFECGERYQQERRDGVQTI
jgi:hypothetical protein